MLSLSFKTNLNRFVA